MKPVVSIIIVNYNKASYLKKCIQSIIDQTYINWEVVVVDNNSSDNSIQIINNFHDKRIKIIQNSYNSFFAEGNNIGYQKASGEFIFLLNNDAYMEPQTIEILTHHMIKNPKTGVIQNRLVYAQDQNKIDSAGSFFTLSGFLYHLGHQDIEISNQKYKIFAAKGASLFFRRKILIENKIFDKEYIMYFEDTYLSWLSLLQGFDNIYLPNTTTYHYVGTSTDESKLPIVDYHSFKNRINCLITHLSFPTLIIILPIHILICFCITIIYIFNNKKISLAIIKAIIYNIKNLQKTLKKRKRIQKSRKISDFYILKFYTKIPNIRYIFKFSKNYINRKKAYN